MASFFIMPCQYYPHKLVGETRGMSIRGCLYRGIVKVMVVEIVVANSGVNRVKRLASKA